MSSWCQGTRTASRFMNNWNRQQLSVGLQGTRQLAAQHITHVSVTRKLRKRRELRRKAAEAYKPPALQQQDEVTGSCQQHRQQRRLDAAYIRELVLHNQQLADVLGDAEQLDVQELLDGVINVVYAGSNCVTVVSAVTNDNSSSFALAASFIFQTTVHGSRGSLILKQALPYVRAVGESFPLSQERMHVEAAAMQVMHDCCPAHVPKLLLFDAGSSILALQYLPPPHQKLLYAIRHGQVLPNLAAQLSNLLCSYLAHTNLNLLPQDTAASVIKRFSNTDIVAANERVVLISPFDSNDVTNRWSTELTEDVTNMWSNSDIQICAADLLQLYRTRQECIIHNDLHAGNLLVAPGSLYLIDWEFATSGPAAFDLGSLMGNIMLAVMSLKGMHALEQQQQQQQQQQQAELEHDSRRSRQQQIDWLLQTLQDVWICFQQQYPGALSAAAAAAAGSASSLLAASPSAAMHDQGLQPAATTAASTQTPSAAAVPVLDDQYWQQLLLDSCGFAGCCLIRLTVGLHHYPDISSITDPAVRIAVERRCLHLGQQMMKFRHEAGAAASSSSSSNSTEIIADVVKIVVAALAELDEDLAQ